MSYSDGEAAVLELLRDMEQFDHRTVTRGDWKSLNSGAGNCYAIIRPGTFSNAPEAFGSSITTWRTTIELWQRWVDDSPTVIALEYLTHAVIAHVERYPTLNGAALIAQVAGGGEVQQRWIKDGGPQWAAQEIYIDWQEERYIDIAE